MNHIHGIERVKQSKTMCNQLLSISNYGNKTVKISIDDVSRSLVVRSHDALAEYANSARKSNSSYLWNILQI